MSKPILYMLNTWYDAPDQKPFYCPDCGIVEGFFIDDALSICNFLAQTYNGILPHPQD